MHELVDQNAAHFLQGAGSNWCDGRQWNPGQQPDGIDSIDEVILPAHGHVIGWAAQSIAQLKAHRLRREAKVLAAMRAVPHGEPNAWVSSAYDDTPESLWPLALRSLTAHVQRIEQLAIP